MPEGAEERAQSRRKWNIVIAVLAVIAIAALIYACTKQGAPSEKGAAPAPQAPALVA